MISARKHPALTSVQYRRFVITYFLPFNDSGITRIVNVVGK